MINTFTHLHLHSQYSLLDGAILIPELVQKCKETGMQACALTDHGWMAGVIDFYKECKKQNIKPLIGVEAYITDDPDRMTEGKNRDNGHMILIAKDLEGYRRLSELISTASMENFHYKPRISIQNLSYLSGYVIATTACLGGALSKKLIFEKDNCGTALSCYDPEGLAEKDARFYMDIFKEDFYLEIQGWEDKDQHQPVYNKWLLEFGRKLKLPIVITADAHYLNKEDSSLHEMIMAMQMGMTLENYRLHSKMQYGPHFYVATPEEMLIRAKNEGCEEAYYNTIDIANKCNVEIPLGIYQLPLFDITETNDYKDFLQWKETR